MTRIILSILVSLGLLVVSSCGEDKKNSEQSIDTTVANPDNLDAKAQEKTETQVNVAPVSGLDVFNMDTITEEEFDDAKAVYKNSFVEDTISFPKIDGVTNIKLKNGKVVTFTDFENLNDETDVRYYYYQGRLDNRLYYVLGGYYEGMEGLLIQANGKIDTIYYSPVMSNDVTKFYSIQNEYGAMGDFGFYYYEYQNGSYYKTAHVEFSEVLIKEMVWHESDAIYCKVYTYKEVDEPNKNYMYLRFRRK